jgi:hypothetical protein
MSYLEIMEKYGIGYTAFKRLMKLAGHDSFRTKKFTSGETGHLTTLLGKPIITYSVGGGGESYYVVEILYYPSIEAAVVGKKTKGFISYFGAYDAMTELMELADLSRRS